MIEISPVLENFFKKIGLSDKERSIYLNGLTSGPLSASILARKTGITRPNTYDTLKRLINKGLAFKTQKFKMDYFVMKDPKEIREYLEDQKKDLEKREEEFKSLLPELQSIYNPIGIIPKIKLYEGLQGMKEVYRESLKCKNKEMLQIVDPAKAIEAMGVDFMSNYVKNRAEKKIRSKALHTKTPLYIKGYYTGTSKKLLREVRYPPKPIFTQMIIIYDNKVAVMSTEKERVGFIIESEEYSQTMRSFFNMIWSISKKM